MMVRAQSSVCSPAPRSSSAGECGKVEQAEEQKGGPASSSRASARLTLFVAHRTEACAQELNYIDDRLPASLQISSTALPHSRLASRALNILTAPMASFAQLQCESDLASAPDRRRDEVREAEREKETH